jgi:AraC-like DNA-binding protein
MTTDHLVEVEYSRTLLEGVELKKCSGSTYKKHLHNELTLGYIHQGSTELSINDETSIEYRAGDGVLISPHTSHLCAPRDASQWSYTMLFIDPVWFERDLSFPRALKIDKYGVSKLRPLIDSLTHDEDTESLKNTLAETLMEFGTLKHEEPDNNLLIAQVRDYLIEGTCREISLEELEETFAVNRFTLIRNFKKEYTTTPGAFHLQLRVAEAKKMLSRGENIFDICESLHFYDQAHLIREFKKMYRITPEAYKRQLKTD